MLPSEAKPEEKPVTKHQTQELTDLTQFSTPIDVRLGSGRWARVNVTAKHGIPDDRMFEDFKNFYRFLDRVANDGDYAEFVGDLRAPFPLPVHQGDYQTSSQASNQTSGETPRTNGNGQKNEFACGTLNVEYKNKKAYFNISGAEEGKFPKFPVRVWSEVLEAAGITEDEVDPKEGKSLLGWTAVYKKNDEGKVEKVIELRKPEFA